MLARSLFKIIVISFIAVFLINYVKMSSHFDVEIKGDIPIGYGEDNWHKDIGAHLQENSTHIRATLSNWLDEHSFPGKVDITRERAGKVIVDISLEPFDMIINDTLCFRQNKSFSHLPCYYREDKVGHVRVSHRLIEDIELLHQSVEPFFNRFDHSYLLDVSAYGFVDYAHSQFKCRLDIVKDLSDQIKSCNMLSSDRENRTKMDFSLEVPLIIS